MAKLPFHRMWLVWAVALSAAGLVLVGSSAAVDFVERDYCIRQQIGDDGIDTAFIGNSLIRYAIPPAAEAATDWPDPLESERLLRLTMNAMPPDMMIAVGEQTLDSRPERIFLQIEPFFLRFAYERQLEAESALWKDLSRNFRTTVQFGLSALLHKDISPLCPPLDQSDSWKHGHVYDGNEESFADDYPVEISDIKSSGQLRTFLEEAQAHGTEIVFLAMPRSKTASTYLGRDFTQALIDRIKDFSDSLNVRVWLMEEHLDDRFFADHAHMNLGGRMRYFAWLRDCLEAERAGRSPCDV